MTTTTTTSADPAIDRCPGWCTVDRHRVDTDGAIQHTTNIGCWQVSVYDYHLLPAA
jgi:hypothetical protein